MPAVLFGSISTLADTSELQREAFNKSFVAHGLDWSWDREEYLALLEQSGGEDRVSEYAAARGETVDAGAIHRTKSDIFQASLADTPLKARPGVTDTIAEARSKGYRVALVTTTTPENVSALLSALAPQVDAAHLDLVLDATDVDSPKPDSAAYDFALARLGMDAGDVVAIEDNLGGVESAIAAGLRVVAFPNENTIGHDFGSATLTVDHVSLAMLDEIIRKS